MLKKKFRKTTYKQITLQTEMTVTNKHLPQVKADLTYCDIPEDYDWDDDPEGYLRDWVYDKLTEVEDEKGEIVWEKEFDSELEELY